MCLRDPQVAEMLNLRLGHAPADERAWATEANSDLLVLLPGPQAVSDGRMSRFEGGESPTNPNNTHAIHLTF